MGKNYQEIIARIEDKTGLLANYSFAEDKRRRTLTNALFRTVVEVSFEEKVRKKDLDIGVIEYRIKEIGVFNLKGEVPTELFEFEEATDLTIIGSEITTIPEEICKLTKLTSLNIMLCELKKVPDSIAKLKNLERLSLSDNKIEELPEFLAQLKELTSLDFSNNLIKKVPSFIVSLLNLYEIELYDNPLEAPYDVLLNKPVGYWHHFFNNKVGKINLGRIPYQVKTSIKQYLLYFQDYIRNIKGIHMHLKVEENEEGIQILFDDEHNEAKISEYLNEYLNFIGSNIDNIQPNFVIDHNQNSKDLYVLELKQQVSHLQMQLKFKEFEVKVLNQRVDDLANDKNKLLEIQFEEKRNPQKIQFITQATANPVVSNSSTNNISINIQQELPKLQKEFLELKNALAELPVAEEKELEKLDDELLNVDLHGDPEVELRKPANRLKRILDAINEEDSTLNKAVKAGDKTIKAAQKLARTYNKIAQWLALPQVPDVLAGKE